MSSLPIVEITDLVVLPPGTSRRYASPRFAVEPGAVMAVVCDQPVDAGPFLRMLATLDRPVQGAIRFDGRPLDLDDYRQCLPVKRRIGYVAADAAMISNLTLRENLLLSRFYFENNLAIELDETVDVLCRDAGLGSKLDQRPAALSDAELLKAITIREMAKAPLLMLVHRPENFIAIADRDAIFNALKNMVQSGTAVVFFSQNPGMIDLATSQLTLSGGEIHLQSV
ncbi:ATP-binding cassette domain-containing protein [Desulfosarcina ovata]|uniref:Lipoprotein-releasing system ATP-binding protein LolD n=1 Tax=Desulfosarcina ovata subsp. ovata TaxID=2752305 RepID=A0A5K8AGA5_9BACT|nr:ATP-binding cassette domain-containing protein [Desulfosarcina ovata]BBO90904.1 lipoprotein-releasing system ATP-binding protein LolD [Desulfosarcina ovata subsp. ovata]